ncbi:PAS domain-containing methyl-accepting chemotaxis protein [Shewanella sp. NIFS-20-20]|uniref:methyl-accepting chemotaxis protein n=1 Tax=Shewanella sp. NIFS-20-20 TaxID=2853806 RepID=UPI001C492CB7|nr:PAS domain-containing methyl-accepting chemotaxis protein [Shewanella sp. NIFS-20-20]MBV7316993.1 PAS domain-containing methyl-accepting chemotaxis protein [Shewanella sp. NIFS-20-20]
MFNSALKSQLESAESKLHEKEAYIQSIKDSVACIEFSPDGTILDANAHFLAVAGYTLDEVRGKHHQIFCCADYRNSPTYRQFWSDLAAGRSQSGIFQRINKQGEDIWLSATYFPIRQNGNVQRVMKIASDVTLDKKKSDTQSAVFDALSRSQAVIEFTPDGKIITANANFLSAMGYSRDQIVGQHHRMFCYDRFYDENPHFWNDLKNGQYKSGQFERKLSSGQTIWLEATYNPIKDEAGKVVKVIKFATDISDRVNQDKAVREAAEIAYSTSEETAQIAQQGAGLLEATVETSNIIADQVNKTTVSINQLNEQSKSIEAIVSTISAIAEQTNLLALNAAIEAARAGDQGRGFAVVADEVRQLAARTSQSTDEIASVVSENRQLTASANEQMNLVAKTADSGKQQISEVVAVMDEIKRGAQNVSQTVSNLGVG